MLKCFERWRHHQHFYPSALGIFVNPAFIVRRGLYRTIRELAPMMTGDLLDFGAGSAPYRSLFRNAKAYITVDIEESGHEASDKVADHFYDGKTLPFSSQSFDNVFSSEVVEHIFNLPDVLLEIHRILKPNGHLLLTAPFVWDEHEIPFDFARYTSFGLPHLLQQAGFEVEIQRKTTGYVATIFQMLAIYALQRKIFSSGLVRAVGIVLLAAPINIIGLFLDALLPKDDRFYHNQVLLCRRT